MGCSAGRTPFIHPIFLWPVSGSSLDTVPGELDIQAPGPRVKITMVSKADQKDRALARDQLVAPAQWWNETPHCVLDQSCWEQPLTTSFLGVTSQPV